MNTKPIAAAVMPAADAMIIVRVQTGCRSNSKQVAICEMTNKQPDDSEKEAKDAAAFAKESPWPATEALLNNVR